MPPSGKILVVDDAATVRQLLRLMLEEVGHRVKVAASSGDAVAALRADAFDVLIVDKNLDDQDGFAVCRAAAMLQPDAARVLITADQSLESAIRAIDEGIYAYLTKPLLKQAVLLQVQRALDRVLLERERRQARQELEQAKAALEQRTEDLERTLEQLLRAQTRLVESAKLVSAGLLAAGVAHEINNPACFILPNLEYIRRIAVQLGQRALAAGADEEATGTDVEHIDRMVGRCLEGVDRIRRVVGTLQIFSRRDPAEPELIDLNALCRSLLDLVAHEVEGRAQLRVSMQDSPCVRGRQRELAQAVLNLLLNARRSVLASPEREGGHEVALTTQCRQHEVVLSVGDTGSTLRAESSPDPVDSFLFGLAAGEEGPDLGLSLTRDILERHGGRLELHCSPAGNRLDAILPLEKVCDSLDGSPD